MDSKNFNSVRNALVGGFGQVVTLTLNFATKTVFIRTLGAVYLGVNGLFSNIFLLMSSIDYGVSIAMNYSLYEPLAKNDQAKISALYDFYRKMYRIIVVIDLIIGLSLFPFLDLIFTADIDIEKIRQYYLLFLAYTLVYNAFSYKSYIIIADQKKYIISFYYMVFDIIASIIQIIALLLTQSYVLYLIVFVVKYGVTYPFLAFKARKMYPCIRKCQGSLSKREKKSLYKNSIDMFLYKLSEMMISGTDNLIISILIGTIYVGYYSNYEFIIQGVTSITALAFASIAASVGHLFAEKNREKNMKLFYMLQDLNMWLAGFVTTAVLVLAQDFVAMWAGKEYVLSNSVLLVIVFNFYVCIQRDVIKMFREAAGLFDKMMRMGIINAIFNVMLSIIFGKWIGMFGVFLATIVSGMLTSYWYEPYLIHKEYLKTSMKPYLLKQLKSFTLLIVSILLSYFAVNMISMEGLLGWLVKALCLAIVSNLLYFVVLGKTEAVKYIFETLKEMKRSGEKEHR